MLPFQLVKLLTCWFDAVAYFGVEPPVFQGAVSPVVLLMLQAILEGVFASSALPYCIPLLPLRLKLTPVGEVQYAVAVEPGKGMWVWLRGDTIGRHMQLEAYMPFLNSPTYFVPVGKMNSPCPSILK